MVKLSLALFAAIVGFTTAFAPVQQGVVAKTSLASTASDEADGIWDPLSLYNLGSGESFDTFPNMFPSTQYLEESEIKQGRMSMLAWTGIWATHKGGLGLGMHFPGFPEEPDWTKALGVFIKEQPGWFAVIFSIICLAEGESVGHTGDNFRGKSTKTPGDLGLDPFGFKSKLSAEEQARYAKVEMTQGRAAMIAMASMFAFESIPGSVPIMDVFGAQ
eukprot:CAMPEP_0116553592 /NCGR_PEP_ID=MMETSP0397-20121206/7134_1 /TAXON_ID=216820 /ORGANISM="Cyclophora tenuis, Strain ECT3854" /LENGTH=216 /DNA_ID=CAMNT_0004078683 /DNA_START=28 /DNA_END=678 /DNA_ORIENTATION=+